MAYISNDPNLPPGTTGTDCLLCFATGETPFYLHLLLRDILKVSPFSPTLPDSPNGLWRLVQTSANVWEYSDGTYYVGYGVGASESYVIAVVNGVYEAFFGYLSSKCQREFESNGNNPASDGYQDGSAVIYYKEPPLLTTWDLHYMPFSDGFSRIWDLGSANTMQRSIRSIDKSNLLLKTVTENT